MIRRLFGTNGRIDRTNWWILNVAFAIVFKGLEFYWTQPPSKRVFYQILGNAKHEQIIVSVIGLILLSLKISADVKRYHDLGKSGWRLLVFVAPSILTLAVGIAFQPPVESWGVIYLLSVAIMFWPGIEMAFFRGTDGPNSYGDRPISIFETEEKERFSNYNYSAELPTTGPWNIGNDGVRRSSDHPNPEAQLSWQAAVEYFPNLATYYETLERTAPAYAEKYKSQRLAARDFSKAEEQYWATVNSLLLDVCGSHNSDSRTFLLQAINNREFQIARKFISLSNKLGAENMNSAVLAKFKKSNS